MSWPKPIRVAGIGSPHGDDALAWEAVKCLQQRRSWPGTVQFHVLEGGQRLLDVLDGKGSLILIDALAPDQKPGEVLRLHWPSAQVNVLRPGSTHDLGPAAALQLADSLNLLPAQVVLWGITGAHFEPNAPMSLAVAKAIPRLVEQIARELETTLNEDCSHA